VQLNARKSEDWFLKKRKKNTKKTHFFRPFFVFFDYFSTIENNDIWDNGQIYSDVCRRIMPYLPKSPKNTKNYGTLRKITENLSCPLFWLQKKSKKQSFFVPKSVIFVKNLSLFVHFVHFLKSRRPYRKWPLFDPFLTPFWTPILTTFWSINIKESRTNAQKGGPKMGSKNPDFGQYPGSETPKSRILGSRPEKGEKSTKNTDFSLFGLFGGPKNDHFLAPLSKMVKPVD